MNELFNKILNVECVKGILLVNPDGKIILRKFIKPVSKAPKNHELKFLVESLKGIREADLIFEKERIYIRQNGLGYLIVLSGLSVESAALRLNCDLVLPKLKPAKTSKEKPV